MKKIFTKQHTKIYTLITIVVILLCILFVSKNISDTDLISENNTIAEVQTELLSGEINKTKEIVTISQEEIKTQEQVFDGHVQLAAGEIDVALQFMTGESLYDVFKNAQDNGLLEFSGRKYPGLGFFITSIGTLREGNGKNLMYFINGEEASVGVSVYVPHDGDVITWELK